MAGYAAMVAGCGAAALLCVGVQYCAKRMLEPRQYGYFRDLLLAGCWMLMALWFGDVNARIVVGGAFLAGIAGLGEDLYSDRRWRLGYLLIGLFCALAGPSIAFLRFADGEYVYLTPLASLVATTLWFTLFPLLFRHLDEIPGLLGHILAVTFSLMLMAVLLMGRPATDAFFMAFSGMALLGAFWSRFGNAYRQAGHAMSAMWSVLAAGTAVLGGSKGIVFSSMLFLSLGLFAIPLAEVSLHWASMFFTEHPYGTERLYRRMIARGLEHPDAVRFVAGLCALVSIAAALLQSPTTYRAWGWWLAAGLCSLGVVLPLLLRRRSRSPMNGEKPSLWGVRIDNVSMNYAVSRARGLILSPGEEARLVATVNALGMEEAVRDPDYRAALGDASMVLADGVGLLWGMRFLGMSLQERVTGIDFAEQLCRVAAVEEWPVYFLGAKGDTAAACAEALSVRCPGLIVAGARDGYFDVEDTAVADAVASSGARILLVAMGLPRQEKWVALHKKRLGGLLAVGVGGAFDVFAGRLSRAPALVQRIGMEWFYRLCQEPGRWSRDLRLASFVLRVLATRLGLYGRGAPR